MMIVKIDYRTKFAKAWERIYVGALVGALEWLATWDGHGEIYVCSVEDEDEK